MLRIARQHFGAHLWIQVLAGKQPHPTRGDLVIRPACHRLRQRLHHHVQMVAHHRVAPDRNRENLGEFVQPILDPRSPMLERAAGTMILTAQKGPAHTARDAVESTGRSNRNQLAAGVSHGAQHRGRRGPRQSEKAPKFVGKRMQSGCPVLSVLSTDRRHHISSILRRKADHCAVKFAIPTGGGDA